MKKTLLPFLIAFFAIACKKDAQEKSATNQPSPTQITTTPGVNPSATDQGTGIMTHNFIMNRMPPGYVLPPCVTATETALMAGQTTNVGTVTVWNDNTNVYVAYQTDGSFLIKTTHLFVGACTAIPVNNGGNPRIGLYPYTTDHGTGVSIYTYVIPRSSLPAGCLCVSAHADVVAYNASGSIVFSQTGWGQGTQINDGGSWAMKFNYCQQDCDSGPR